MTSEAAEGEHGHASFGVGTIAATSALLISLAAIVLLLRRVGARSLLESHYTFATQALAGAAVLGFVYARVGSSRRWRVTSSMT